MGAQQGSAIIQGMRLDMAVAGAILSYILQAASFIVLRLRFPGLARPYRSPAGIAGAIVTLAIALLTLAFQLLDAVFAVGVLWMGAWFALGIAWFALVGRHRLVLAPEEVSSRSACQRRSDAATLASRSRSSSERATCFLNRSRSAPRIDTALNSGWVVGLTGLPSLWTSK